MCPSQNECCRYPRRAFRCRGDSFDQRADERNQLCANTCDPPRDGKVAEALTVACQRRSARLRPLPATKPADPPAQRRARGETQKQMLHAIAFSGTPRLLSFAWRQRAKAVDNCSWRRMLEPKWMDPEWFLAAVSRRSRWEAWSAEKGHNSILQRPATDGHFPPSASPGPSRLRHLGAATSRIHLSPTSLQDPPTPQPASRNRNVRAQDCPETAQYGPKPCRDPQCIRGRPNVLSGPSGKERHRLHPYAPLREGGIKFVLSGPPVTGCTPEGGKMWSPGVPS